MNSVHMMGRLTRDVELRSTPSGTPMAKFGIAVNSYGGKDSAGKAKDKVCFLDCVCFGKRAETLAKCFHKGDPIIVEGELEYQQWENDGARRSKHELNVRNWEFTLNSRTDGQDVGSSSSGKRGYDSEEISF